MPKPLTSITLTTSSSADQVSPLCEALHALCLYASGSEKCALDMQTAVAEALNNVILHAYHQQPGHEIKVCWSFENKQLRIEIIDTGSSIQCLPEPTLPDFDEESSRGWWIINACVDEYYYQIIEHLEREQLLKVGGGLAEVTMLAPKSHTNVLTLLKRL